MGLWSPVMEAKDATSWAVNARVRVNVAPGSSVETSVGTSSRFGSDGDDGALVLAVAAPRVCPDADAVRDASRDAAARRAPRIGSVPESVMMIIWQSFSSGLRVSGATARCTRVARRRVLWRGPPPPLPRRDTRLPRARPPPAARHARPHRGRSPSDPSDAEGRMPRPRFAPGATATRGRETGGTATTRTSERPEMTTAMTTTTMRTTTAVPRTRDGDATTGTTTGTRGPPAQHHQTTITATTSDRRRPAGPRRTSRSSPSARSSPCYPSAPRASSTRTSGADRRRRCNG